MEEIDSEEIMSEKDVTVRTTLFPEQLQSVTVQNTKMCNRSTSIDVLDRNIGGGLPPGSVVYLLADAKSMAEMFLYQLSQSRDTYYFINDRNPKYVTNDFHHHGLKVDNVAFIDIYGAYYMTESGEMSNNIGSKISDNKIIEFTEFNLKKLLDIENGDINIIFDTFSFYLSLDINQFTVKRLINVIYEITKELNCVSFLYGIKDVHSRSIESEILKCCDAIFDIDLVKGTERLSNRLSITKLRGRKPNHDVLKFKIGDTVQIDTTEDIV